MRKIVFVTGNKGKVKEAQEILGKRFSIEQADLDLEEIQAIRGKEVIRKKAKEASKILKKPVLVEDTSLYFDAWNGLPGVLIRWFLKSVGCTGLCQMMAGEKNRKAWAETALAFHDGKKLRIFSGKIEGEISPKPRGKRGFGWDPIFTPKGTKRTFAQMKPGEKNEISMRKEAFDKLKNYLVR